MSDLITAIRQSVKSMVKPDLVLGEVVSFNASDYTIEVKLNQGSKVENVTIKSVLNGVASGILVEPKIGSFVLCGLVDGRIENLTVLSFDEIKSIKIIPSEKITLRADDFGGIVKSQVVHDEIKQLKDEINDLKQMFTTWVPVVYDGGAALKAALATFLTPIPPAMKTDYENENILHG